MTSQFKQTFEEIADAMQNLKIEATVNRGFPAYSKTIRREGIYKYNFVVLATTRDDELLVSFIVRKHEIDPDPNQPYWHEIVYYNKILMNYEYSR